MPYRVQLRQAIFVNQVMNGYACILLTANDDMIERTLPGFAQAMEGVRIVTI